MNRDAAHESGDTLANLMSRALSIVIVEDNAETRHILRSFLVKRGHTIALECDRGDDERLWTVQADVAVVDLNLPGADGIDVIDELRERMPCLALTSSSHDAGVTTALLKGALGYVVKGAPMAEVIDAVERVADRQSILRRVGDAKAHLSLSNGRSR
jgi:DNA-binding NarL/FixJ family response regulator